MTMTRLANRREGEGWRDTAHAILQARRDVIVLRARRVLLLTLLERGTATADDVREAIDLPAAVDPVCFGAVPGTLARAGIIRRDGYVPTSRADAHARIVSVWKLVDRTAAERWLSTHPDVPELAPDHNRERRRQLQLPGVAE